MLSDRWEMLKRAWFDPTPSVMSANRKVMRFLFFTGLIVGAVLFILLDWIF